MNRFANLKAEELKPYFQKVASEMVIPLEIAEKDFWVCWVLKVLFEISDFKEHLTFKGGTSLSKAYGIIKRFSEDVDVSIDKTYFGFIQDKDPEQASGKKKNKLIQDLANECRNFVKNELYQNLNQVTATQLSGHAWKLELDTTDKDEQTLLFYYPSIQLGKDEHYISPFVRIELGARSDHWPTEIVSIRPYVEGVIPGTIQEPNVNVKVLKAERTFWEKATILHKYAHYPIEKVVPARQSRHYYDFYCLLNSTVKERTGSDLNLLKRVTEHKDIYFKAAWANYLTAKKGSLKLIPGQRVLEDMRKDYKSMESMLFGEIPTWESIIKTISDFESTFNIDSFAEGAIFLKNTSLKIK